MKIKLEKMFSIFKNLPMSHLLCILVGILIFVAPLSSAFAKNSKITVMTRNLYLGADIFRVVDAAQNPKPENGGFDVPIAVGQVYQIMLETNFSARANAIADEIAANKPQVIGLNEVETFIKMTTSFQVTNVIDFYTILNAALLARGMDYQAFSVKNADITMPMVDSAGLWSFVKMVDHDYILVRKGNTAAQKAGGNYVEYLKIPIGGTTVEFKRGYLIVDVNVKGEDYRIACTHPEVRGKRYEPYRVFQFWQMQELLGKLESLNSDDPKPTIMVGDFNSSPDDSLLDDSLNLGYVTQYVPSKPDVITPGWVHYTPPYTLAVAAGYLDSWLLQNKKHDEGYTSGFDEFVSDPDPTLLDTRIDLIFLKLLDLRVDRIKCDVVGNEVSDMVFNTYPYPKVWAGDYLWPSDHAGVAADMQFKVPK
jgi:endonuclease/exonuclease/phosphatase family metal-dependent hydrolase